MSFDADFEPHLGRIRDRQRGRRRGFVGEVLSAARRAGYMGGGRTGDAASAGRGKAFGLAASLRSPGRRVIVKVRIVRHMGRAFRAAPLGVHLAYLQRDGVDRHSDRGEMFAASGDASARGFATRCEADRHHFRIIVSPEDASQLQDLRGFARELMHRAETDLGTRLDWIAVGHWNTGHPHLHILVRGRDEAGEDLVIAREYLSQGLRARAEALVSLELGPRTAREISGSLERETSAERWTGLDRLLRARFPDGRADLRPGPGGPDRDLCALLAGRAMLLERLGLAQPEQPGVWRIAPDAQDRLQQLADRAEALGRLQRLAPGRALAEMDPDGQGTFVGRLVARGLHDEFTGQAYAVVDGLDGRLRHVRTPDLAAAGDTAPGGVVEVQVGPAGPRVLNRSDLELAEQVTARGATWLDRRLVARSVEPATDAGFGSEVLAAMNARQAVLLERGHAEARDGRVLAKTGLLATLRTEELAAAAAAVARDTGLRHAPATEGQAVAGLYLRRLDLASGRFAVVLSGPDFQLLPWAQALDRRLGRAVGGQVRDGLMHWDLGRGRER